MTRPSQTTNPRLRTLTTPEGIELTFELASAGDRIVAFFLDGLILVITTLVLLLIIGLAGGGDAAGAFFMVFFFLLRTGYFVYFELGSRGATLGKRSLSMRVVNRAGGPLEAQAVFARNLTRELEIFLPLLSLMVPDQVLGVEGANAWLSVLWVFVFLFFPLFNRDRLRVGDLIGGTWVVKTPKPDLLQDVGETRQAKGAQYTFSDVQLSHYGNFELQTLEDLLRRSDLVPMETLELVSSKIRRRIDWDGGPVKVESFLRDFYTAQRAHLERGLLFGRRHEDKGAARAAARKTRK